MVTHRINRVELEFEVSAVELGRSVSDRISRLHGQRIPSLLDRVCSEIDESEPTQRIDKLELELGTIALSNFDDELLGKLEAALRLALRGRVRRPGDPTQPLDDAPDGSSSSTDTPNQPGQVEHALELLDTYAWTGNLPWWADTREVGLLARHIRELLVHAPGRWLELLREHADDRVGIDRLARAFDGRLFEMMLERVGAGASLVQLRPLVQLLERVGVHSQHARSPLLAALARHGRLEPTTVLQVVLDEMEPSVIAALVEQLEIQPRLCPAPMRAAIIRAWTPTSRATRDDLELAPQDGRDQLERSNQPDTDAAADARSDSEQAIDPVESAEQATSSARSKTTSTDGPDDRDSPVVDPAQLGSEQRSAARPTHDALRPPPTPTKARAQPDDPRLQLARRRALARLDELYIEDAGLVILWPFIERLFTRVELLDERRFRDEPAQTQAIAMLAHLALGDPEAPEHRLAFAKLLCGRSPEQPCELDGPLDVAVCDECDAMLTAVIDHAPILDAMPIPRFRASFLQRAGALGVRAGSWLLTVERQPYDLVLERFSWSWAWVKLPWMPDPLTVEW
jgi:hypothetical protein